MRAELRVSVESIMVSRRVFGVIFGVDFRGDTGRLLARLARCLVPPFCSSIPGGTSSAPRLSDGQDVWPGNCEGIFSGGTGRPKLCRGSPKSLRPK